MICVKCGDDKADEEFVFRKKGLPRRRLTCRSCDTINRRRYPKTSGPSGKNRTKKIRKNFSKTGVTATQYAQMLENQHGGCKICGGTGKRMLAVDHCHSIGKIRALLCVRCNIGLGYFLDNPELL